MGFNPDTSNAHHVYIANRQVVTVEHNVTFECHNIVIGHVGVTSEGENMKANENYQQLAQNSNDDSPDTPTNPSAPDPPHHTQNDHLGTDFKIPAPQNELIQSSRQCTESLYMRADLHQVNWMQDIVSSTSQYRHLIRDFIFHHLPTVQMLSNLRAR